MQPPAATTFLYQSTSGPYVSSATKPPGTRARISGVSYCRPDRRPTWRTSENGPCPERATRVVRRLSVCLRTDRNRRRAFPATSHLDPSADAILRPTMTGTRPENRPEETLPATLCTESAGDSVH